MIRVVQIEPGPMPTLTRVRPASTMASAPARVATLPAITSIVCDFLIWRTVSITLFECPWAESTTRTSDACPDQRFRPLQIVDADRRSHPQPPALVLARGREVGQLVDVLDRDQAPQFIFFVNQQQFLDFIFRQNPFSRFKRCIFRGRDQIVLGHDFAQALIVVGEEAQVAAGEDALAGSR